MKKRKSIMVWASAVVVAAVFASAYAQQDEAAGQPQNPRRPAAGARDVVPQLSVRGDAQLDKPADQMNLQLGVITQAAEAAQAMQENSRIMQQVIAAMEKLGLTKEEYQTGRFDVQPQYGSPPRNPEPNWKPRIVGYQVTNTLRIKTTKLEIAGDLIQAATQAGANNVESIFFDLADPRKHRAEAIKEATKNAMGDARALAAASGQKLVRVLSIQLDGADAPMPMFRQDMMGRGMAAMEMDAAPPITPGDITIRAGVSIVYQIAPSE